MKQPENNDTRSVYSQLVAIKYFKFIRPNLVKLMMQIVLLYLSIKGFVEFQDTQTTYADFMSNLNRSLIMDVKSIREKESCPEFYESIETTYFPEIFDGCRCDLNLYERKSCGYIETLAKKTGSATTWKTCVIFKTSKKN